jgi:ribonuclease R
MTMNDSRMPRRADVIELLATQKRAIHFQEIFDKLGTAPRHLIALNRVLDDLVFDGTLVALPGQRFKLSDKQGHGRKERVVVGFLSAHARGFAFVAGEGGAADVFIPAEAVGGALHGDKVEVRIVATSHRGPEGAVSAVLERRPARISGTLRRRGKSSWLEPDDTRIRGPVVLVAAANTAADPALPHDGNDGDVAIARITRFPDSPDQNPEGVLEEVLGPAGTPQVEVRKILAMHAIVEPHDHAAVLEAEAFGGEVSPRALEGRKDLTHLPLPTIDPEDARDHDDAVWAVREDDGSYRVWVAIADVSAYVTPGSALDTAALARGNSIYLPDRAIPMLPRALSSNLCSLLPGVLRLCLCVEIELDATGEVRRSNVVEGFMRSCAKLTYEGVARALGLTTEAPRSEAAEALRDELRVLRDIAGLLRQKRMRRGALDFNLPEAKIVVDPETKEPVAAVKRARDPGVAKAYQIVEELMLLANETVAAFLVDRGVPTIFRNHAAPDQVKIERFAALCARLDVPFDPEEAADPKKLSAFLKKTQGHPQRSILDTLLVRSMKQAAYDVANIGHFGLASKAYLHFTSPIRRYPDLVVHRAVRALLRGESIDRSPAGIETLRLAAVTASERERRGMEVEREVVDLYRALFMKDKVGDLYTGTATGFVASGVFVTIDDPYVEVLVRTDALGPDSYQLDEDGLAMIGTRSGDRIDVGDTVALLVEDVAVLRRTIYGRRVADDLGGARHAPKRPKRKGGSTSAARSERSPRGHAPRGAKGTRPGGRGAKGKKRR